MRGAMSTMYSDHLPHVTLKIWFKTGGMFEEDFPLERTTFADVKYSAIRQLLANNSNHHNHSFANYRRSSFNTVASSRNSLFLDEIENYKLVSIVSKRMVDEDTTLGQQKVKNGDEYLLAAKRLIQSKKPEQVSQTCEVGKALIESRTQDLSKPIRSSVRDYRPGARTEFRTDLNRILITLIETSQRLLWSHPDAENIFKQAEDFLLRTTSDEATHPTTISAMSNDADIHRDQRSKLVELGFTEKQARIALKRTKYDLHSAMDLLLTQASLLDENEDDEENENNEENQPNENHITEVERIPLYSRNGPFISFRKFRQQRFQPNTKTIRSLKEIGFAHDDIVTALRMFNNDENLACEYLLSDKQQQQNMHDAENEQGLDPNSSIFQSIIQNPIVQRTLNNPKTFFIMLQIAENPTTITNYLNDPDIGNMLLQISRIYHAEKENMNTPTVNRRDSDHQDETLSRTTGSISGDFDDDSD